MRGLGSSENRRRLRWRWLAVVAVLVLAAGACGDDSSDVVPTDAAGDSDPSEGDSGDGDSSSDDSGEDDDLAGALGDSELFVSREYLQGEWCDDEGNSYSIDGDIAVIEDGSGGVAEFPIDLLFIRLPGIDVDQSDNEFSLSDGESSQTFTRGSC